MQPMNTNNNHNKYLLFKDLTIILLSIFIAVILVKTHVLTNILTSTKELELFGSFIAGMFFTSVFTTAPAIVTLGEIAKANSIIQTALLGAMGAVIGDLIIFRFVRDRLSEDLMTLISHNNSGKRIKAILKIRLLRWLTFLVGGLIIASPLPDELGIGLLGFSKVGVWRFAPFSFTFNFIGILLIGLVAKSLP